MPVASTQPTRATSLSYERPFTERRGTSAAFLLVVLALSGCDGASRTRPIETTRVVERASVGLSELGSTARRFGLTSIARAEPASTAGPSDGLRWDTPPGWTELAPTAMRRVGFEIGDDERTECYLSALPGDAGGLAANVDRWRQQMSLAPLGPEELAALPRAPILDRDAVEIDLRGTWKGMSGREDGESFRMIGWLAIDPQGSLFFRIVGPSAVVDREADAFRAVGRSFRRASGRAEVDAAATAIAATSPKLGRALAWQTPEGWQRAPDRPMREVGFSIGGNPRAEAYVTVLFGQAGGALANVNRWRQQMGRPALARAEIEDLPRIDVLGGEALVVEVDGSFTGMDGARVDEAYLLGAVCTLADCTVFVKLTGPRDVVAPERERFVAFCRSLTSAEK